MIPSAFSGDELLIDYLSVLEENADLGRHRDSTKRWSATMLPVHSDRADPSSI